jgi:hypothetical protein
MPEVDLSDVIPPEASWVKLKYEMRPKSPEAQLIARVWSGQHLDDAVILKGESGDVFVRLEKPQSISFQRPVTVELKLKVVAYKSAT